MQGFGLAFFVNGWLQHLIAREPQQQQPEAVVAFGDLAVIAGPLEAAVVIKFLQFGLHLLFQLMFADVALALLVDGGVHEKGANGGGRAVDGHRYRGARIAEVEARVELLGVVEAAHAHARVAHLAVDVGAVIGIFAVEGHAIEGGRQAVGRHVEREVVETAVGALRTALAGEHAGRVFALALEGEYPGGVRKFAGHIFL